MSKLILETRLPYGQTLQLAHGDLTSEMLDAIVNAASHLNGHLRFPKERASGLIFAAIRGYFEGNSASGLDLVRVTIIDQQTLDVFASTWEG